MEFCKVRNKALAEFATLTSTFGSRFQQLAQQIQASSVCADISAIDDRLQLAFKQFGEAFLQASNDVSEICAAITTAEQVQSVVNSPTAGLQMTSQRRVNTMHRAHAAWLRTQERLAHKMAGVSIQPSESPLSSPQLSPVISPLSPTSCPSSPSPLTSACVSPTSPFSLFQTATTSASSSAAEAKPAHARLSSHQSHRETHRPASLNLSPPQKTKKSVGISGPLRHRCAVPDCQQFRVRQAYCVNHQRLVNGELSVNTDTSPSSPQSDTSAPPSSPPLLAMRDHVSISPDEERPALFQWSPPSGLNPRSLDEGDRAFTPRLLPSQLRKIPSATTGRQRFGCLTSRPSLRSLNSFSFNVGSAPRFPASMKTISDIASLRKLSKMLQNQQQAQTSAIPMPVRTSRTTHHVIHNLSSLYQPYLRQNFTHLQSLELQQRYHQALQSLQREPTPPSQPRPLSATSLPGSSPLSAPTAVGSLPRSQTQPSLSQKHHLRSHSISPLFTITEGGESRTPSESGNAVFEERRGVSPPRKEGAKEPVQRGISTSMLSLTNVAASTLCPNALERKESPSSSPFDALPSSFEDMSNSPSFGSERAPTPFLSGSDQDVSSRSDQASTSSGVIVSSPSSISIWSLVDHLSLSSPGSSDGSSQRTQS